MGDNTHIISFKVTESEKQALEDYCHNRLISKSVAIREFVRKGLESFEVESPENSQAIQDLYKKIESIEQRISAGYTKPKPLPQPTKKRPPRARALDCADIDTPEGDALLSREDIARKWGYSISTLNSKMSRDNIIAVCRINGNRAGRYLQSDVIKKWGAPLYD